MREKRTLGLVAAFLALGGIAVSGWVRHAPPDTTFHLNASSVGNSRGGYSAPNQAELTTASVYSNHYEDSYRQDGYYLSQ